MYKFQRIPKALSFSSYSLYGSDRQEFFLRYLAANRAARLPQERPMSVGSAFDAYVKAEMHASVFGPGTDPNYAFDKLFVDQVEEHNRDWALEAGKYILDAYKRSGSYDAVLTLLLKAHEAPRFESTLDGQIAGVPFTGKPDLRWVAKFGDNEPVRIIFDFKVKGFCSKYGASPTPGYMRCHDGYDFAATKEHATKKDPGGKPSASHGKAHAKYLPMLHRGLEINTAFMETCSKDYADQISCYGWLLGEEPGDENVVVWIDEIVSTFRADREYPLLRVANHRARVGGDHQLALECGIQAAWREIQSGHIFSDLSEVENDARCAALEDMATSLQTDGTSTEDWFNTVTRPRW